MSDGFPIGAIIAFPGNAEPPSSEYWALCDGSSQSITGPYAALFAAIGFANGGSSASGQFNLPDYRGRFLRGTDYGSSVNIGANSRTAMNPGGNTGDAVGSVQGYETGAPRGGINFSVELPHLPVSSNDNAATAVGDEVSVWNSGSVNVNVSGGDKETRPLNAYVLFFIKYRDA
jgi:microcystin-dependent protein